MTDNRGCFLSIWQCVGLIAFTICLFALFGEIIVRASKANRNAVRQILESDSPSSIGIDSTESTTGNLGKVFSFWQSVGLIALTVGLLSLFGEIVMRVNRRKFPRSERQKSI
jgi:hypothetical protein